ncbi:MAG: glycoside hydrolase family 3 C-terminal domain-containing protein, partial [Clostridia bacterium]|nr:glycoside hydrolase family 3 C-terminal domain-containing protein [Clostridia bacterium]
LIDHAVSLCGKADVVLLYLAAEKGADRLPPEQLGLIDVIAGRGAKIVAVVASQGNIDLSFADKCAAVLLTFVSGQGGTVAALDIITGEECPSGKLATPMGRIGTDGFTEIYPVGYGLSYTRFEYSNLKASEDGVSFTVRNVGNCDGYAVSMLGVRKKNTKSAFIDKQLRGYAKAFVPRGDAVRVKISFDELTFSQYDETRGYFVEGGLYTLTVGETPTDEKLSGILLLKDYEERSAFKNEVEVSADDGRPVDFSESGLPASVKAARKKLPFGLKLALALMVALYVDAVLLLFALGNIVAQKDLVFYVVIGVIALVVNTLVIVYICIASKQRKSQKYIHANTVLTDMLDNVEEFTEIAKVRYKQPVAEEKKEEEKTEEEAAAEAEAQELAATYEVKFDDSAAEDVVLSDKVSFNELCSN